MTTQLARNRILQVAENAPSIRAEILSHLLISFEDWQTTELDCAAEYCARDWFAIQHLDEQAQTPTKYSPINFSI